VTADISSEDRIVRLLRKTSGQNPSSLKVGIGDDAAVLLPRGADELWVVTTDLLLEDIDFRGGWLSPAQLGHKSLAANLSDLAAMGARPRFHTVALGLPRGLGERWIASFYQGMKRLADALGTTLIGGDLSRSEHGLHISVCAIGESSRRKLLYRSGGNAGDLLFVTGTLGLAAAGLKLLELGRTHADNEPERLALSAQREPAPRCSTGTWLARSGLVSCMMDLSDGLSADLPRLCAESRTGAEIYSNWLPVFGDSVRWGCDPVALAFHGGEDFELLFAVPRSCLCAFNAAYPRRFPPVTQIGRLTRKRVLTCRARPRGEARLLPPLGFDHFRKTK
jgi:thiamine-monophosphate kinase